MRFTNTIGQDKENELLLNSLADRNAKYGPDQLTVLNDEAFAVAQSTISAWPGYAPTPLVSLNTLAAKAKVAEIFYKDEGPKQKKYQWEIDEELEKRVETENEIKINYIITKQKKS